MIMFNRHLIIVIKSFFTVAFIYSPSSTLDIFGEIKTSGIDCIPEKDTNIVTCCYKEYDTDTGDTTAIYCAQCYDDGIGNLACDAYDKVESIKPPDDDSNISPKNKGLLGLLDLDNPTIQPDDSTITPKGNKGLSGLLDETSPTIQQPLPKFTTPQRNIPNDLLSNLDDNLLTSIPEEDSSEPLNLLEEDEQQESPVTKTDTDNDENILKDEDKEEEEAEEEQEEQLSLNQEDDEIQSEEVNEQEESNEDEEQLPPITEILTPNED